MHVVYLPAAAQFPADGVGDDAVIVFQYVGLHRTAILWGFFNDRHIADTAHRHVERAGDGGGGKRQHVHLRGKFLDSFFLRHAEALLLVHDKQTEVAEFHVLGQHAVSTHQDIQFPRRHIF